MMIDVDGIKRSSMDYWYPKIKVLPIPQPKTLRVNNRIEETTWYKMLDGNRNSEIDLLINRIQKACKKIGYPVFLRTDHFSGKHDWKNTCYIEKKEDIGKHLWNLVEANFVAGMFGELPISSFYVREYVQMNNLFKAFWGKLPINPEIRLFIDKEYICHHWYWIEDAIAVSRTDTENWRTILSDAKKKAKIDLPLAQIKEIAKMVGKVITGYWSVDLCQSINGEWYLIDMAAGELSWHPEECEYIRR